MKSRTTEDFWKCYRSLPGEVQKRARKAFQRFKSDPYYPGLRLKRVHSKLPIYSVRVSLDHRVLGVRRDDTMVWFWIGSHEDYEKVIKRMRGS